MVASIGMATSSAITSLRPKYVHPEGLTRLTYSPDGLTLYTVGHNQIIRKFDTTRDDEPQAIEHHQDVITGVVATNANFYTCSEDATVSKFDAATGDFVGLVTRATLPVRDICLSPDGEWLAVASDETVARLVDLQDVKHTLAVRPQGKSVYSISYSPMGDVVAACTVDGSVTLFAVNEHDTSMITTLDHVTMPVDAASGENVACKAAWHPNGLYFAVASETRDLCVYSRDDLATVYKLAGAHTGPITDFQWSANGAFLASAGQDGKVCVWDCSARTRVSEHTIAAACCLAWHPTQNILSVTTYHGQLITVEDVVPSSMAPRLLRRGLKDITNAERTSSPHKPSRVSVFSEGEEEAEQEDELEEQGEESDWIEDDDGAGYVPTAAELAHAKKRKHDASQHIATPPPSHKASPTVHAPVHTGSTPWRAARRYLAFNMIGHVWTVQQEESHNTVSVEFMDSTLYRRYHFQDPDLFDMACLNENAALFANSGSKLEGSVVLFRPHQSWAMNSEWRLVLPRGEACEAIAQSTEHVVLCTSKGYVRVYTVAGVPVKVMRHKHTPFVACAAWRNYVWIIGNGGARADGRAQLTYSIDHIGNREESVQSNDVVALPPGGRLTAAFFSEEGDPYILDSDNVLLVLEHWRVPGGANWVPVLDSMHTDRREGREEYYWPVTVHDGKFHCVILKGLERHPFFPRPFLSEIELQMPCVSAAGATGAARGSERLQLEEMFMRAALSLSMCADALPDHTSAADRALVARKETEIDTALLKLVQIACIEERSARALSLARLLHRDTSKEAARRIALHYSDTTLAEKMTKELTVNDNGDD